MAVEGKTNALQEEQNLERPVSPEGMLKSFALTRSFQNRPLRRFQRALKSNTSQINARIDKRFFRSNVLSEALRQFSRRTFGKRRTMSLAQGGTNKEKGRKWSALAMTLPSGTSGDQGIQPASTSLSSRTFTSGSSIPAFSLPDQGSIFSQVSSAVEQAVSKPKWKPPEPGARRFSRVEEVQASTGAEASSALGTAPDTVTTVQKSPKPAPQATPPTPGSARPAADTKPAEPAARPIVAAPPTSRKLDRQKPMTEISTPQSGPSQQRSAEVFEPSPKIGQHPSRPVDTSSPAQQVPGSQISPVPGERQVPFEPRAETQMPALERSQTATQTPSESLPKGQSPAANKGMPGMPIQEPAPSVQMPLASRRGLPGTKKSRQNLISQHRYHLSRPQPVLPKAAHAPAIQRKTFQLPLKRRVYLQTQPASSAAPGLTPASLPVSQSLVQPITPVQVPAKVQALPIPEPKSPSAAHSPSPEPAAPTTLQTAAKNAPLQRKSLHLPLKRPVLAARKPSAAQARRLNIAAMPLRQAPAKGEAAKPRLGKVLTVTPPMAKISSVKPSVSSKLAVSELTLPTRVTTDTLQVPVSKADLATKLPTHSSQPAALESVLPTRLTTDTPQAPAPKADLAIKLPTNSSQAAEIPALPSLAFPLISKSLLQRVSSRKQMLRATPFVHSQHAPGSLTSVLPKLTRVSRLPGQSIQRSLYKGYPVIPTRNAQRPAQVPSESLAGNQVKFPKLSAQPSRFEAALPAKKPVQPGRPAPEKPSPLPRLQPSPQKEAQTPQLAPQPVLQPRQKAGSMVTLPPTVTKNKVLSLTALRKGTPILSPRSANESLGESGQAEIKRQPKFDGKPAVAVAAPKQPVSPIRAIRSSPVVQRKVTPEDEGWMYQSSNQDLPLASQSAGPQPVSGRQNQTNFASSSGSHAPGQSAPSARQHTPSQADESLFSTQHQQQMPPEPPLPSGYVNPFADEPRPEMPLRTPIRPNTFESSSQSDQEMPDLSGGMREESHAAYTGGAIPPQTDAQNRPNLQELARKVYPEIVRMLNVETEWLGRRL